MIPAVIVWWTGVAVLLGSVSYVCWRVLLWLPGALVRRQRYRHVLAAIRRVEQVVERERTHA